MFEIRTIGPSGSALYAHLTDRNGRRWNGTGFEVYSAARWSAYAISLTEQGASGAFFANFPLSISAADLYEYVVYQKAAADPAESDRVQGTGRVDWDGAASAADGTNTSPGQITAAGPSGMTLYAHVFNTAGRRWNGSSFEVYLASRWSYYSIPLSEQGASGVYTAAFPSAILTPGSYEYIVYSQGGGSPAEGDRVAESGVVSWLSGGAIPTPNEVRANLEGYMITQGVISDAWISNRINRKVVPWVNNYIRSDLLNVQTKTKLYSGTGTQILLLDEVGILAVQNITLVSYVNLPFFLSPSSVVVDGPRGILRIKVALVAPSAAYTFFPKGDKNIQITYTVGFGGLLPVDIYQAVIDLASVEVLRLLADRTGGGSLRTQGYDKNYGDHGKYTNLRKTLSDSAIAALMPYTSREIGS